LESKYKNEIPLSLSEIVQRFINSEVTPENIQDYLAKVENLTLTLDKVIDAI
jgi:hypothetical protein